MKTCPDYETGLTPIKIFDQLGNHGTVEGLAYTRGEKPKLGVFSAKIKNSSGHVHAFLCESCTRVLLYAQPS